MKKILIIGGTAFIGRVLAEELLKLNKYDITLFNRGKTNPDLFPEIKRIQGDRNTDDVKQLGNQYWDVVFDISGYYPASVETIADVLKDNVGRYVFISTVSVFNITPEHGRPWSEEDEPLPCSDEQRTSAGFEHYGHKKAECERQLLAREWLDAIIMRPALVYGKYDYTDRSYYWLHKVKTQDRFLLPDGGKDPISYTYVHDLVKVMIAAIDIEKHNKVYNLSTHPRQSLRDFTEETAKQLSRNPQAINASPEFLEAEGIQQWSDLPLWIHGDYFVADNTRMVNDFKVPFTPFPETIKDTIAYYDSINWPKPKTGISVEREAELLEKIEATV